MTRSGKQWFQTLKDSKVIEERKNHINFNRNRLYENAVFLDKICANLADELVMKGAHLSTMDRVAGAAKCAIFAHDLARQISTRRALPCLSAHLKKVGSIEYLLNVRLKKTERTTFCVDVLDSELQVKTLIRAVSKAKGIRVPYLATLWNCTGRTSIDGIEIVSLISSQDKVLLI